MTISTALISSLFFLGGLTHCSQDVLANIVPNNNPSNSINHINHDNHDNDIKSYPSSDIAARRELPWGQLNFLHTTDTHGWLPGHLLEPEFSADWGDYIAFVAHMRSLADSQGVDLLVVDSGDRHDGNGLSDATSPGGTISQEIFKKLDFDIITIGNHELYQAVITQQEYDLLKPYYGENYVVTNVDIELSNGTTVPLGNRYRRFTTKNQGLEILAFGVLFDFTGNDLNSRVTPILELVEQDWLNELLEKTAKEDNIDAIVLAGHLPVRYFKELDIFVDKIRQYLPQVPIQALGGHVHIRDFRMIDDYAAGLGSGRYLETIGWASIDNLGSAPPLFGRRYIDFNREALTFHSNTTLDPEQDDDKPIFYTKQGISISQQIKQARLRLNLSDVLACVPQTYFTDRAQYPGRKSIFTLLEEHVLRLVKSDDEKLHDKPRFIIVNSGSVRFDMFEGPFTKDSGYIVSPFRNDWVFVRDLPIDAARKVLPMLNRLGQLSVDEEHDGQAVHAENHSTKQPVMEYDEMDFSVLGMPSQMRRPTGYSNAGDYKEGEDSFVANSVAITSDTNDDDRGLERLTKGYVTTDDFGSDGDDTPHRKWNSYYIPNAIQSEDHIEASEGFVDVVFYDFVTPYFKQILQRLGIENAKVEPYGGKRLIELLPEYLSSLEGLEC